MLKRKGGVNMIIKLNIEKVRNLIHNYYKDIYGIEGKVVIKDRNKKECFAQNYFRSKI